MPNPTPGTIEELKAWYIAHNLPPEDVTRFFIGKDTREPRAFGIYQEDDRFIVYKNKSDGSRAIRYHGPDEAYAVNELYLRLKQEIASQKGLNAVLNEEELRKNRKSAAISMIIAAVVCIGITVYAFWSVFTEPDSGYYRRQDQWYYCSNNSWYVYCDDDWSSCDTAPDFADHCSDYYVGSQYDESFEIENFELTEYYSHTDTDSSWDSGDSWDSDSTDWGSDW